MAKCVGCGELYPTGIVADLEMVERKLDAFREVATHCPFCGKENVDNPKKMAFTNAIFPA